MTIPLHLLIKMLRDSYDYVREKHSVIVLVVERRLLLNIINVTLLLSYNEIVYINKYNFSKLNLPVLV